MALCHRISNYSVLRVPSVARTARCCEATAELAVALGADDDGRRGAAGLARGLGASIDAPVGWSVDARVAGRSTHESS